MKLSNVIAPKIIELVALENLPKEDRLILTELVIDLLDDRKSWLLGLQMGLVSCDEVAGGLLGHINTENKFKYHKIEAINFTLESELAELLRSFT